MYSENYVIFKGTKDGVTVLFDPEAPFDILCSQLEKKVEEAGRFFDNVKTSMAFKHENHGRLPFFYNILTYQHCFSLKSKSSILKWLPPKQRVISPD